MKKIIIGIIVIAAAVMFMPISCTRIGSGYDGILVKQYGSDRGVQNVALVTGRVWYNPWTEDVEQMPTFVQTIDYKPFKVNTKDGSEFTVDPTLSFGVTRGKSPGIFVKYRRDIEELSETTVYGFVKDAFRMVMNKYTVDEAVSNREKVEDEIQKVLTQVLERDGFFFENLTSGLRYPPSMIAAINDKNKSIQDAMKQENNIRKEEALAKIKIIRAEADRKANELKQTALTPMLIQQQFIEKWDGSTPLYGSAPVLFKNAQ